MTFAHYFVAFYLLFAIILPVYVAFYLYVNATFSRRHRWENWGTIFVTMIPLCLFLLIMYFDLLTL